MRHVVVLTLLLTSISIGQHDGMNMDGKAPVRLEKGLGPVHHRVTIADARQLPGAMVEQGVDQGAVAVAGGGVDDEAGGLVDD